MEPWKYPKVLLYTRNIDLPIVLTQWIIGILLEHYERILDRAQIMYRTVSTFKSKVNVHMQKM
jgi:hypothetical protein